MENENLITLSFENRDIELNINTASLWTFMGRVALNHIWIRDIEQEENGIIHGSRIFWQSFGSDDEMRGTNMGKVGRAMVNYGYEAHLNLRNPNEDDIAAYLDSQTGSIDDELDNL